MVVILMRNIQATNMILSSLALVILVLGIIADNWIILKLEANKVTIHHSPWMQCCFTAWPEDDLEVVRIMMILTLSLSFLLNLVLGMEFTYLIPPTIYIHFITATFSFLAGILLLSALLIYHHRLWQGQFVYFCSYKITWILHTAYINITFFIICGILSLLSCLQFVKHFICLNIINKPVIKDSNQVPKSGNSIRVISSADSTKMPHGIVRLPSQTGKDNVSGRQSRTQVRHVTWAL
ncbi:PREDICTED: transmembrane protein 225 [Elephantulus edwardii]|uniref:transmembrane protein 225 n=1 Tax=Elephantulus edwardii TaxID=28737 RepID=UPI0003F06784|nr:PREDICTED: transmembrane protein 225 [Elephantulus edwardii]